MMYDKWFFFLTTIINLRSKHIQQFLSLFGFLAVQNFFLFFLSPYSGVSPNFYENFLVLKDIVKSKKTFLLFKNYVRSIIFLFMKIMTLYIPHISSCKIWPVAVVL